MKETFSIIVAMDSQRGIGKDGTMPWSLPEDMAHFKKITTATTLPGRQNVVIMGRKTWESIPERFRPLTGRINIVLTRDHAYPLPTGVVRAESFDAAFAHIHGDIAEIYENIYVIGGEQIFSCAITDRRCTHLFITHIDGDFACDTFFPSFESDFILRDRTARAVSGEIGYSFCEYARR